MKKHTCLQLTNTSVRAAVLRTPLGGQDTKILLSGEKLLPQPSQAGNLPDRPVWTAGQSSQGSQQLEGTNLFDHPGLSLTVGHLFNELSLRQEKVLLSVTGSAVLFKRIQMPAFGDASTAQQTAAIEADLENHISVNLDQSAYDWCFLEKTSEKTNLFITCMRKKPLESLMSQLESIGIEPVYVMPAPLVLANQLLFTEDCSRRICGIHIDGTQIDFVVLEAGQVMGGRSFSVDRSHSPNTLWRMLKQSLAGTPNPNQAVLEQILIFQTNRSDQPLLTPDQVEQELGVSRCDIREPTDEWASALLRGYLHQSGISLNLLMPILRQKADERKLRQKQQLRRLIPLAAAVSLAFANLGFWNSTESTRLRIEKLETAERRAKAKERQTKPLQKEKAVLEKKTAELVWSERRFPPLTERLKQIAHSIPKEVRLKEIRTFEPPRIHEKRLTFDAREKLLLRGLATSQEEIDAFRAALATQKEFNKVLQIATQQITIKGEKWLEFTLSLTSRMN